MNTKIYYYFIGALVFGITGLLLFQNNAGNLQDTILSTTKTGTVINSGVNIDIGISLSSGSIDTGNQNNPLVYTNTEYGFQLTLPKGWEDYSVFIYTGSNVEFGVSISFILPTTEKTRPGVLDPNDPNRFVPGYTGQYQYIKGYADMLVLNIWTHEGYKQEQKRCNIDPNPSCVGSTELLGNNQSYYFTYFGPQDLPIDISAKISFGSYYENIKNSFKIL